MGLSVREGARSAAARKGTAPPTHWTFLSCSKVYLINEGEYDLTAEEGPFDREEANSNPDPRQGLIKRGEAES